MWLIIYMGAWDLYCPVCGNPSYRSKIKWLNKCSMLLADNTVVHNTINMDYLLFGKSTNDNNNRYDHMYDHNSLYNSLHQTRPSINYGIMVHTDCWKYVKQDHDIELKYGDLVANGKIISIDFGVISKYQSQFFEYERVYSDGNEYMCTSPLKCDEKNIARIKKIIRSLKLKSSDRKSPSISATFFKPGTCKIGNDGNFWHIAGGRWVKMPGVIQKDTISFTLRQEIAKKMLCIPQIGEDNTKPKFITSCTCSKSKMISIDVISLCH
jgi:hypothetical protein